jgi:tight adherence protein B
MITRLAVRNGALDITLAPTALPAGTRPSQATVQVLVDGKPVASRVTAAAGTQAAATRRTVVLALDTSGSMLGAGLQSVQQAGLRLLAELPADVRVGLVRFADDVVIVVPPTTDRPRLRAALAGLRAAGSTKLYDAVPVALSAAGTKGERRVMLLTDGRDDGSRSDLSAAVAAVKRSGTTLDVVDASVGGFAGAVLRPLALAGGGRAVAVSGARLSEVFRQVARSYLAELTVGAILPPALAGQQVKVEVILSAAQGPRSQTRTVNLPASRVATVQAPTATTLPHGLAFWLMLTAVFLGCFLLLLLAVTTGDTRATGRRRTWQSLSAYSLQPVAAVVPETGSHLGTSQLAQSAVGLADRTVERRGSGERLALALDRAGLAWRPGEWLVIWTLATVAGAVLVPFLLGGSLLSVALGAAAGWLGPRQWLAHRASKRRAVFLDKLPDVLQMLSASLATGYSLAQAVDAVVQEGAQPVAGELGRALAEARIGVPLEDALDQVADRLACDDFRWVVMAIRVQHQVGGNLSEVLMRVCTTMRERASLRRQVRALSAEGRASAYILVALPLGMAAFMFFFRRSYFRPMYTETVGIVALAVTALMLVAGMAWMSKLVKVEM